MVSWIQDPVAFVDTVPGFLRNEARYIGLDSGFGRGLIPFPESWWQNQMFADAMQLFGEWVSNYFVSWKQGNLADCLPVALGGNGGPCGDPGTINQAG